MHRFYAHQEDVGENSLIIRGDEAAHMRNALRMKAGDEFIALDGSGIDYTCTITSIAGIAEAYIIKREANLCEPAVKVTLYQAYPKLAKMNEIVQKAVELGAAAIVPFLSERCVKRPFGQGEKLSRVALSAVKQSGRSVLPEVPDVQSFEDALARMKRHEQLIVCWEEETQASLRGVLQTDAKDIGIVIGPEGGFETAEIETMIAIGGDVVTLGRRIMRTETAGIAVLAAVFYDKGQMQY